MRISIDRVGPERAADVLAVIHGAFGNRPPLDPPATALEETLESVTEALAAHGGLLGEIDDEPAATLLFLPLEDMLGLRRVGTLPSGRGTGIAAAMVAAAEAEAVRRRFNGLRLMARTELPSTVHFWQRQGYTEAGREGTSLFLRKMLPVRLTLPTAEDTRALGVRLAAVLQPGDLLLLTGDLGAGKTTLTQGIGEGLGVRGDVTSPTFVIARVHPPLPESSPSSIELVHVDAYRLHGSAELDDLDLDTDLDLAVTVVEWGEGLAETLSEDRLEIMIHRDTGGDSEVREMTITPYGQRWFDTGLAGRLDASRAHTEDTPPALSHPAHASGV